VRPALRLGRSSVAASKDAGTDRFFDFNKPKPLGGAAALRLAGRNSAWSPTSANRTRLPGVMPNASRTALGIVTWPFVVTEVVSMADLDRSNTR
jgi:hypothetical protein